MNMAKFVFILLFLLFEARAKQYFYNIELKINEARYITSPNYPAGMPFETRAKWFIKCPEGYNCKLYCPTVNLETSYMCHLERFLVSKSNTSNFYGAQIHCGERHHVKVTSTGNVMVIGYLSNKEQRSEKEESIFLCTISSEPVPGPSKFNSPFVVDELTECDCGKNPRQASRPDLQKHPYSGYLRDYAIVKLIGLNDLECVGTIVSERYILATATCVHMLDHNMTILLQGDRRDGDKYHKVEVGVSTSKCHQTYSFDHGLKNPIYTKDKILKRIKEGEAHANWDVAIIQVENDTFKEYVALQKATCLPYKYTNWDFEGMTVHAVDWTSDEEVVIQNYTTIQTNMVTDNRIKVKNARPGKSLGSPLIYKDQQTGRQTVGTRY